MGDDFEEDSMSSGGGFKLGRGKQYIIEDLDHNQNEYRGNRGSGLKQ